MPPDQYVFAALFSAAAAGRTPDLLDLAAEADPQLHRAWALARRVRRRHARHAAVRAPLLNPLLLYSVFVPSFAMGGG